MNHKLWAGIVLLAALFSSCQLAWSQAETGTIGGTVTDQMKAVIPGASVTAKSVSTGAERTVQSGVNGQYLIEELIPGLYDVTVTTKDFAGFKARAEVTVGGKVTVNAQMSLSGQTTVMEVVGEGGAAVNTQSQELSQIVNTEQMAALPSLTRNAYDFVALSGNVSSGDSTSNGGSPNNTGASTGESISGHGVGFSLNGQRNTGTEVLLDGVENIAVFSDSVGEQVPIDSVQEYSVITNNFSPEYGRASGGVVNVSSKSGTNDFHGGAWEFNRLSAYTANTYENAVNDIPKGIYTRNQFGFAAGGPIIKNKLFIFESTEWTRVRSAATETEEVFDPTFTAMLPANSAAYFAKFATGALPSTVTVTAGDLASIPPPGTPLIINSINGVTPVSPSQPIFDVVNFHAPFDAGGDVPQNTYRLLGRIDYNLNDNTTMFFRAGRESVAESAGAVSFSPYPQYNVGVTELNQSFLYSLSHLFSPNLLNTVKASFVRFNDANTFDTALTFTPNLYINSGSPVDPATGNLIQMPGLENTGPGSGGLPFGGPQNTFQLVDDLGWTKGAHSLKFGGEFTYIQLNVLYDAYAQAVEELSDTGDLQGGLDALVNNLPGGPNPNGSPLLSFTSRVAPNVLPCLAQPQYWNTGSPSDLISTPACEVTPPLQPGAAGRSYRYNDWALYAMDSFKVARRLTLNYGLRYEHYGVQHDNHQNLDSNFYFGPGAGLYEKIASGGVDITTKSPVGQFWTPRWGTAAPRVGFAWDIFGDGKTSLRGGFGISYERNFGNVTYNAAWNPPAIGLPSLSCPPLSSTCTNVVTNNGLGVLGTPGPPLPFAPSELRMPDPNIEVAQTQFWSLDLQRELAPNTIIDVSYSGAHGVHLYDLENVNLVGAGNFYLGENPSSSACAGEGTPNDSTSGEPICLVRPNQQYSNINMRGSLGSSAYDALNVKFQTQNLYHTGVTLVANYTWAHSLDDISSTFSEDIQGGSGYIGSLGYTNVLDPKLDWGSSDFDIRHRIVISPIWQIPWFKEGAGWQRQALGGWTIASIFTAHTGIPFSVYDYSNDFNFYTVPRLTPATPIADYHTTAPVPVSGQPGVFTVLTLPVPASSAPLDPALGISDFGPYPANMTRRNGFRGPGAWNDDLAISKNFKLTERFGLEFRAEAFNVFNHHNLYAFAGNLDYSCPDGTTPCDVAASTYTPLTVNAYKGGLGNLALGGNHDERRFGQFALKLSF